MWLSEKSNSFIFVLLQDIQAQLVVLIYMNVKVHLARMVGHVLMILMVTDVNVEEVSHPLKFDIPFFC